ncbi:MAG: hypothetical protein KAZ88_12370, partial [Acidimicrobiia bacterium]|nr:hypothetical protein [Acidimicrobiia bacterium]
NGTNRLHAPPRPTARSGRPSTSDIERRLRADGREQRAWYQRRDEQRLTIPAPARTANPGGTPDYST